jgi:hypothetical protein
MIAADALRVIQYDQVSQNPFYLFRRLTRAGILSLSSRQTLGQTNCNARALTPKDFKHVRAALEHLVALEVLERERRPGRKAKWLYRRAESFEGRVVMMERSENDRQAN